MGENMEIDSALCLLLTLCAVGVLCWSLIRNQTHPEVDVDNNRDRRETETWVNQTYSAEESKSVFMKWVRVSYPYQEYRFHWQLETYRDSKGTLNERCIATESEENWKIATLSLASNPPVTLVEKRIWFDWATWALELNGGTPSKYNWMASNIFTHIVTELKTQDYILFSDA